MKSRTSRRGPVRAVVALTTALLAITLLAVPAYALASVRDQAGETTTAADDPTTLSWSSAAVLGLVEGITEYLPISSTGHLLVAERVLDLGGTKAADDALDTYTICIQAGAIVAVLLLYRRRVGQMIAGLFGRDVGGRQLLVATVVAFVPTVIIALALEDPIRSRLFGVGPVAAAWLVGGLAILFLVRSDRLHRGGLAITDLSVKHAAIIGVAQSIALWPGVSRSLVTIIAALLLGLSISAAVEFSFILGLATLGAATIYEGAKNGGELVDVFGVANPLIGLVVAFVSAVVAVRWMVGWLEQRSFEVFGWYRIAAAVIVTGAVALGAI